MEEYKKLKEQVEAANTDKKVAVKNAEDAVEEFTKAQTFTGEELLAMRDDIKRGEHGCSSSNEPWLNYILERILTYREG